MKYFVVYIFSINLYAAANIPTEGNGQLFLTLGQYQAKSQFFENKKSSEFTSNGKFTKNELSYYLLYSLRNNWALFATGSVINNLKFSNDSSSIDFTGSGDHALGARYLLKKDYESAIALQALVSVPLYSDTANPGPGNGQNDIEIRYLHDLYQIMAIDFISLEAAYRHRLEAPADQIRLDVTGGKSINSFLLMGHIFYTQSLKNDKGININVNPYVSQDYDLLKIGPSVAWRFKQTDSLQLGLLKEVYGRNTGDGHYIYLSWWKDYSL